MTVFGSEIIPPAITQDARSAIVVSFCAGKPYYFEAAERLEQKLDEFGVDHDIVRLEIPPDLDWIDICKQKIRFYRDMLVKHQRPIVWLDVDTILLRRPDVLLDSPADLTCFLRGFKYFVGFDPELHSRLLAPGYITFGFNQDVLKFLDFAVGLVENSPLRGTDDYFLQEALTQWDGELRVLLMKPSDIALHPESDRAKTAYFVHGDSGHVGIHKGEAEQHNVAALSVARQKRVLQEAVQSSAKRGDREAMGVFHARIRQLDPKDSKTFQKYLEFLAKTEQWSKLQYQVERNLSSPVLGPIAERQGFLARLALREWDKVDAWYARAQENGSVNVPLMKSRMVRFDLDRRAEARGIDDDERVKMWWMETPYPGNFGDIINPYVIEGLTGAPPKFTHGTKRLIAIGSIIKFARAGTTVWGAGSPRRDDVLNAEADYRAVRGPLTRQVVLDNGGSVEEVYGDAAWFLPKIYHPHVEKTHKLGVILHVVHEESAPPVDPDVKLIDLKRVGREEIEAFIRDLLSCESVISTSLHGVIMAHAYGIPVRWAEAPSSSKQIHGDGLKFEDYFQSVGRSAPEPLNISALERISSDMASLCVDNPASAVDLRSLAEVAPFSIAIDW